MVPVRSDLEQPPPPQHPPPPQKKKKKDKQMRQLDCIYSMYNIPKSSFVALARVFVQPIKINKPIYNFTK